MVSVWNIRHGAKIVVRVCWQRRGNRRKCCQARVAGDGFYAIGLVIRRLPQPLPGTGAIAEYADLGNFGMRVIMSYQPNTLSQQFTVDVLYGTAALRNNFAVQVNS